MEIIADFHLHSKYARATSKLSDLENIYKWCKIKGINVIGTGDFTHPRWYEEITLKLEPAQNGLYKLKDKYSGPIDKALPKSVNENIVRFILTTEISNIYSKYSKTRRLHNLLIFPNIESVLKFNQRLGKIGNIKSDGRPILGLDSKDLLKITKDVSKDAYLIPAHIWTPWFSMFGSKSGFDSIEEAFEELSKEIFAIETGLSSDPFMNWRLSALDKITIISNSDAHSAQKLGREANILDCRLDYDEILSTLKTNDKRFIGTIEFFPQEGMYHLDGHRKCNIRLTPLETTKYKGICPKCHKDLVIGVQNRVGQLADRPEDFVPKNHKKVEFLIPLTEILAEIHNVKNSIKVTNDYESLYRIFGSEFEILRNVKLEDFEKNGYRKLGLAIEKMRNKDVYVEPGYDGVYGVVKVFSPNEKAVTSGQLNLGV